MPQAALTEGRPGAGRVSRPVGVGVLVVVSLVLATPMVLARGSARDSAISARPSSVTGAAGDGRLTLEICERAVSALLRQDLTLVASGQPDTVTPSADAALGALGGPGTPATARVDAIRDQLLGPATTDVINAYQRDVTRLLSAYAVRIATACRPVSTT